MTIYFILCLIFCAMIATSTLSCVYLMKNEEVARLASWRTAIMCTIGMPTLVFAILIVAVVIIDRGQHLSIGFGGT